MTASTTSYTTQIRFCRALNVVRSLPDKGALQPTSTEKLNLYGLYKQATQGDCSISRPSSRQMGRYAKWKSWERRRGLSPVDAQRLYVNSLVELLVEFINRYPDHEQTSTLSDALQYIDMKEVDEEGTESFVDAWDPEEAEKEEYYLAHLGPHQLELSEVSSPEQQHRYRDFPTPSLATFTSNASTHQTFPETPDLSPPTYRKHRSKYVRPNDFLATHSVISDTDTIDREVAAATASLGINSPSYHPYKPAPSERALEGLQTDITALSEQLDMMRKSLADREKRDRDLVRWSWLRLVKAVIKHTMINSLVLLLIFLVLLKRKSPIALAIAHYMAPRIQEATKYMMHRVVFWKVTV
ncbi:hypothetical protein K492DRAFT_240463 [Lichtheimia hyalospora FSU 10163]|nr:hypothetical protein K492DRAFT_240463 [Lichtheimia hyalospora FSU 10163]